MSKRYRLEMQILSFLICLIAVVSTLLLPGCRKEAF